METTRAKSPSVFLAPVGPEDAVGLADLRVDVMQESLERIGRFNADRARVRLLSDFDAETTRHIVIDGQSVGFTVFREDSGSLHLDHLYIAKEHQGCGAGGAALDVIAQIADEKNLPLRLGALRESDSNRFYQRHGFTLERTAEWDNYYVRLPQRRPHSLVARALVQMLKPLDATELDAQQSVLKWIDSGASLCRTMKPATPSVHLVSYFVLVDGDYLLLVDHINADLWLPTGGHVEPDEHPRSAASREAREELNIDANFILDEPIMVSRTRTVNTGAGRTADAHEDVSLWFVLQGSKEARYNFDGSEFRSIRWFHFDALPLERSDPTLARFVQKWRLQRSSLVQT